MRQNNNVFWPRKYDMNILKLCETDIEKYRDDINDLMQICFQETYGQSIDQTILTSKIEGLKEYIRNHRAIVFGAIENEELIGFAWSYPMKDPFETVLHVAYISTKTMYRRQGIGKRLLRKVEEVAKEQAIAHVELIVGAKNKKAIEFYTNCLYSADRYILRKPLEEV